MLEDTLLMIVYYVTFPVLILTGIWLIRNKARDIKSVKYLRRSDKIDKEGYIKKVKTRIKMPGQLAV